eukprot:4524414-Amphidinium_carterae.1
MCKLYKCIEHYVGILSEFLNHNTCVWTVSSKFDQTAIKKQHEGLFVFPELWCHCVCVSAPVPDKEAVSQSPERSALHPVLRTSMAYCTLIIRCFAQMPANIFK